VSCSNSDGEVLESPEERMSRALSPLPILKLRIPKSLIQSGEAAGGGSLYRRVVVRKEWTPKPRRRLLQNNRFAQKLRSLSCKVDLQKFRFKVSRVDRQNLDLR
jgi:hypothetical protein